MKRNLLIITVFFALTQGVFAHRDLETGTFLTRDPIGYADGPNLYCYVHCNPITRFDAWGLEVSETTTKNDNGSETTTYQIEASIVFEDDRLNKKNEDGSYKYQDERNQYVVDIMDSLLEGYNGDNGKKQGDSSRHDWNLTQENLKITISGSAKDVPENNHMIIVTSEDKMPGRDSSTDYSPPGLAERGGGAMWINTSSSSFRTAGHEATHWFGSKDTADPYNPNLAWQSRDSTTMELNSSVVNQQQGYAEQPGAINNNLGPRSQTSKPMNAGNREALKAADPIAPREPLGGY